MLGRTFIVVLFFWAALTIVTPILVRMSASAKLLDYNGETNSESSKGIILLSRRALGSMTRSQTERPSPGPTSISAPTPAPTLTPVSEPQPIYIETKRETIT